MLSVSLHRTQSPIAEPEFFNFGSPFSSFDFVEGRFGASASIRRCFSVARSNRDCKTLVLEQIRAIGLLAEENAELSARGCCSAPEIIRLSFWTEDLRNGSDLELVDSSKLIGYLIVKKDGRSAISCDWHVFEAVFSKYNHRHNCVPDPGMYSVGVGDRVFTIAGLMYCQQNGLSNACAHVALRSLLSRIVPGGDVSYADINKIAAPLAKGGSCAYDPARGLTVAQIRAVLDFYGVAYHDVDYSVGEKEAGQSPFRKDMPYQKLVYSGVESGLGALVGFNMPDPQDSSQQRHHIIPFYGHTFNKDTWVSDAEACYFNFRGGGYIPSESWTSSFIGHDDNFGCNFCVPRLYIQPQHADYVVELLQPNVRFHGVKAELAAFTILPELIRFFDAGDVWQQRLERAFKSRVSSVILRSVCVTPDQYFKKLGETTDWKGNAERKDLVNGLSSVKWPSRFWTVEVSLPQLFPANERKVGDIVLDATASFDMTRKVPALSAFLFARFPGSYFIQNIDEQGKAEFYQWGSDLKSHVPVICRCT